ncbi:interleukin-13 receptor subunit alpha-2-like [Mustelus asterias]
MFQLAPCFMISFALQIASSDGTQELPVNMTELNPPTNITIVDIQLGELTFTWNDSLSEDIKKSNVRYLFEYKYLDSHTWQEDSRLRDPEYSKIFELHRGVSLRIKNVLIDKRRKTRKESNWTVKDIQPPSGDLKTMVSNFLCIVYNHSSMNCTWRAGSKAPTDTQYVMHYSQGSIKRCVPHLTDANEGCHADHIEKNCILICVNGSSDSTAIRPYYTELDPQLYEIYNPPVNLEVSPNLTVKWDMPPGYNIGIDCFAFELEVTDLDEGSTKLLSIRGETEYVLVNLNPTKRHSVKVRMKLQYCKETRFWSEWSNEDFIERSNLSREYLVLLILPIVTMMIVLLLLFTFTRYKVLEIVFKPIPDPQKKFKALFDEYNGNFQNWINYQIPNSKVDECYPVTIEENPQTET